MTPVHRQWSSVLPQFHSKPIILLKPVTSRLPLPGRRICARSRRRVSTLPRVRLGLYDQQRRQFAKGRAGERVRRRAARQRGGEDGDAACRL